MYIHHNEPRYRAPLRTQAPAADKTLCPFCNADGFKAPGCKVCGTFGYHSEEPPRFNRRIWRLKGRDFVSETEGEITTQEEGADDDETEELRVAA